MTLIKLVTMSLMLFVFPMSIGYILTFDMPWGPVFNVPPQTSTVWFFFNVIHIFNYFLPSQLLQKVILFSILLLGFNGIRVLLKSILVAKYTLLQIFVATLYIFNPFFYTRLMAGQWLVLLGYALLPWAVRSFYIFFKDPRLKTAWPVAAWMAAIGLTSIHTIGIAAFAGFALLVYSGRQQWRQKLKWGAAIVGVWLIVNAIWLVPFVSGQSNAGHNTLTFSHAEMEAFATKGTVAGSVPLSAALLTGFWADDQNRYILPSHLPLWYVGVAIVGALVVTGIVLTIRRRNRLGITFLAMAVVAWLLAMGIAWPPSALITKGITAIFPYFNGYREPQKWLMLVALCYVYFAAIGADRVYTFIIERKKSDLWRYAFVTVLIITPFLFSPALAWGAAGQLKSTRYPAGWYDTKQYLNNVDAAQHIATKETKVLVFPWHIYLPISFTGRVVANPSGYFFDQTMVTSDNFELKGVPPQNPTSTTRYVSTNVLPNTATITAVGQPLHQTYAIDYIMLLKEADWQQYAWLNRQTDLVKVVDNDSIVLYKIVEGTK